jgi:hypothetical protein
VDEARTVVDQTGKVRERNDSLFDLWSLVHLGTGIGLAWVVHPLFAWIVMALWEPLEIFVVHPVVYRLTGLDFGYETWRNSLSDIFFNTIGVLVGYFVLRALVEPPFVLGWFW